MFYLLLVLLLPSSNCFSFIPTAPFTGIPTNKDFVQFNKRADVICIGEVLYDCIADADCNGMTFAEVDAKAKWTKYPGGAPANVACALSRLGVRSLFAGAVGDDPDGEELIKMLVDLKVEPLCTTSSYPTRKVQVTRNDDGDRIFSGFYGGAPTEFFADCHYQPPVSPKWLVEDSALAMVMGTVGLYPSSSKTASLMRSIKKYMMQKRERDPKSISNVPLLVIDLNVRDMFWGNTDAITMRDEIVEFAKNADIIKLTDEEAAWAFDVTEDDALQNPEILVPFLEPNVGILITGGERGASYYINGIGSKFRRAYTVTAIDTTGAGDAFTAGFLAAIAMDKTGVLGSVEGADRALDIACITGALACTKPGAIASQPSLDQVVAKLLESKKAQ